MTATSGASAREGEDRPRLRAVRDESTPEGSEATDREPPIGTSDGVAVADVSPTRVTGPWARARLAASKAVTVLTDGERWRGVCHRLFGRPGADSDVVVGGLFRPPDVWTVDRPALRKQLNYARWGVQHPSGGALRAFSVLYAGIGLVFQASAYYLAWIVERPGRLLAAYGLYAVLMQVPAVRDVVATAATVLTAPLSWLA